MAHDQFAEKKTARHKPHDYAHKLRLAVLSVTVAGFSTLAFAGSARYNTENFSHHAGAQQHQKNSSFNRSNRGKSVILFHNNGNTQSQQNLNGLLRDTIGAQPNRQPAKIIKVSDAMKRRAEERAARRQAALLEDLDQVEFKFYRPNEAYDSRFPSIVYLDTPRK